MIEFSTSPGPGSSRPGSPSISAFARYPAPGESAAYLALPLLWFNVLQVRLLTRLVKTLGRQAERLARVLTNDPGTGVMRHVDAGYDEAIECAQELGVKIPML